MGKGAPIRHVSNIGDMIRREMTARAMCDTCAGWRDLDLLDLAESIGADYSLWNRRTRCRLTDGCQGINRFYCNGRGRFEPMRD
jgi:hypothetical protein